ncbi:RNA-directed DNA polymerase, eukaryota, reverse transcriptase zinc-binding domain protein [Tanacetum coccineum]
MVNNKPLMVYKWDLSVGMKKTEPKKVPVWIKLFEVPMEAWTTKGISAISSSMGRPLIIDNMTTYVCKNGVGRTEFVRVLVEVDADKGFKEAIELQYRDKQHKVKGTKTVKVVCDWKPSICSHRVVFGHDYKSYKVRIRIEEEIAKDKADANLNINKENSFVQSKGSDLNKNKVNTFDENFLALNTKKSQESHNNKNGKQVRDNNSFTILSDLEMISYFKRSWEADREKEKNDMEGMVEDVLKDESQAAKNCEAEAMLSDISDPEIKSAMFRIGDCKAPGPDGYTACFFKKAWSIVGNDACLAIKELFMIGKLLKEINSTLIALIPKIHHPNLVTDFRPIACCNVLYKCISKILTNRIKDSLDKLVNLNQSAFI